MTVEQPDARAPDLPANEAFLRFAQPEHRQRCQHVLDACGTGDWVALQQAFLREIDDYIAGELAKPAEDNIGVHEAGGQWRIAFPHLKLRPDTALTDHLRRTMELRKAFTDAKYYHGYPDAAEVHHEIETYLYFQMPLVRLGMPGAEVAIESIEDVAHHIGNWADGVPEWYDWSSHGFRSTWLGTREVRCEPPYDYQEANHFRFIEAALTAFLGTGRERYLDLCQDYAGRWCDHIETLAKAGQPIRCSILPSHVEAEEMGYSGSQRDETKTYKVFYNTVSANTAYDIAAALLDLYWVTGHDRYLTASRLMMDQFYAHGANGRPAHAFSDGKWVLPDKVADASNAHSYLRMMQFGQFLCGLAVKHDLLTGTDTYRQRILDWASQIDETTNVGDQAPMALMAAAHFYDGDPSWLARGYAMALRVAAVTEAKDGFHQCDSSMRQGSKAMMTALYLPLLGMADTGTRGNLPVTRLRYESPNGGGPGLPRGTALRTWRLDSLTDAFEAVNRSGQEVVFSIIGDAPDVELERVVDQEGRDLNGQTVRLAPDASAEGRIVWRRKDSVYLARA